MTANHTEVHQHCRELVYSGVCADQEVMSLRIPELKQSEDDPGYMTLPLYSVIPAADKADADIELVHIYPLIYDTPRQEPHLISQLPAGYLYVFVDGYLWRELQVDEAKAGRCPFRDINLAQHRGSDDWFTQGEQRPASGEPLKTILVPHKLAGKATRVEIAYSEVQWCWELILKLGGMNPLDPRQNGGPAMSFSERMCPDEIEANALREQRLAYLDNLADFENGFVNQGLIQSDPAFISHVPGLYLAAQTPVVVLTNGLHVMRQMEAHIGIRQKMIEVHLLELQGSDADGSEEPDRHAKSLYDLACKIINTFYQNVDTILEATMDPDERDKEKQEQFCQWQEQAVKMKQWRTEDFDENKFFDYLGYDELMSLAWDCLALRQDLVAYLKDQRSPCNFTLCLEDYGYHRGLQFFDIAEPFQTLVRALKTHPAHQFAHLIRDPKDWDNLKLADEGQDFLLTCLDQHPDKAAHGIYRIFFPKTDDDTFECSQAEEPAFSPHVDLKKIQQLIEEENKQEQANAEQLGRRLSQFVQGISVSVAEIPAGIYALSRIGNVTLRDAKVATGQGLHAAAKRQGELGKDVERLTEELRNAKQAQRDFIKLVEKSKSARIRLLEREKLNSQLQRHVSKIRLLEQAVRASRTRFASAAAAVSSLNNALSSSGGAVNRYFQQAREHVLKPVMQILNAAWPGLVKKVRLNTDEAVKGKVPQGTLLFADDIYHAAQKKLNNQQTWQNDGDGKKVTATVSGIGTVEVPLKSVLTLDRRVKAIVDKAVARQAKASDSILATVVFYVLDKASVNRELKHLQRAAINSLSEVNDTIEDVTSRLAGINSELDKNSEVLNNFRYQQRSLNSLNSKLFPKGVSVNQLRGGMIGLLSIVGVFELINITSLFKKEIKISNNQLRYMIDLVSAIGDTIAVTLTIWQIKSEMASGAINIRQLGTYGEALKKTSGIKAYIHTLSNKKLLPKAEFLTNNANVGKTARIMTYAAKANFLASGITAGIAIYDSFLAYRQGEIGTAIGQGALAAGSIGLMVEAGFIWAASNGHVMALGALSTAGLVVLVLT